MTTKSGRMIELIDEHVDKMHTPEFAIIGDGGLWDMEVCTSLTPDEVETRANLIPPKDGMRWIVQRGDGEILHCHHQQDSHRHMVLLATVVRRG